jgi:dihydroneopterin aldolase/2-amino-4-hydroxy-6-hydroxymethyldihydropteridine diphosphokinase
MRATLKASDLCLWIHLGCTAEEQASRQEVRVSFELTLPKLPEACTSDELRDTICYAEICEKLRKFCTESKFKTIETLTYRCMELVSVGLPEDLAIKVAVHKVRPPVDTLHGGASFTLERSPE